MTQTKTIEKKSLSDISADDVMELTWSNDKSSDVIWYTDRTKRKISIAIDIGKALKFLETRGFNIVLDSDNRKASWDFIEIDK